LKVTWRKHLFYGLVIMNST